MLREFEVNNDKHVNDSIERERGFSVRQLKKVYRDTDSIRCR